MPVRRFSKLPPSGAWRLLGEDGREGFEVARFEMRSDCVIVHGSSVGVESGKGWAIRYRVELDSRWRTRRATIENEGSEILKIRTDGVGRWLIGGARRPQLDGCLDLDIEASVVTNLAPVRRLALRVGQSSAAPAVYVRTKESRVERLEQSYARSPDAAGRVVFDYAAPRFAYRADLQFARDGLVAVYPGIGERR